MTNGEAIAAKAVNRLAEFQSEQPLITTANSTPLPGALRNAFKINPDIQVDKYTIRPVVDRDVEFLQELEHPLYRHVMGSVQNVIGEIIRGRPAWQLCYLFTHPFREVKALFKSGGASAVNQAAEDEFDSFGLGALLEIVTAVMKQMEIYWEPVIGHKAADETDGSKKNILAGGADNSVTALDTNSKNDAS